VIAHSLTRTEFPLGVRSVRIAGHMSGITGTGTAASRHSLITEKRTLGQLHRSRADHSKRCLPIPSDNLFMDALDWDDPAVEEHWCGERRRTVTEYLAKESLDHGEVGSWPAWHVVPYVSIWAVESLLAPGYVGWWVICGDLPTDYLSAATIKHPRKAMLTFADTWKEVAGCMVKGVPHPSISIGPSGPNPELASLLQSRSDLLRQFAEDDSLWGAEYD